MLLVGILDQLGELQPKTTSRKDDLRKGASFSFFEDLIKIVCPRTNWVKVNTNQNKASKLKAIIQLHHLGRLEGREEKASNRSVYCWSSTFFLTNMSSEAFISKLSIFILKGNHFLVREETYLLKPIRQTNTGHEQKFKESLTLIEASQP